ncbi:porin [uncultured Hoeflea sp.]|uniref:porin n=1 Tax=uncultured Hoeflea sp. TaxID=538666 RepID=UPI00262E61EE|nr:porin [uncultured Hoeflea sp.]
MNIKSLLLGSAAALVAVSGARAADAIVAAEPEPVEYVRVCDAFGTGYFYIPGTETCLRIHGYIRYDIGGGDVFERTSATGDETYYKRARVSVRTSTASETELGTLRTHSELRAQWDTNGQSNNSALTSTGFQLQNGYSNDAEFEVNFAWIQLGGLRIGKDESFFTTWTGYAGPVINDALLYDPGPFDTNLISYTYNGGAFRAGLSLEQGNDSYTTNNFTVGLGGIAAAAPGVVGWGIDDYVPHVVVGLGYNAGMIDLSATVGFDSRDDFVFAGVNQIRGGWAGKVRVDVTVNDQLSLMAMLHYGENSSAYTEWRDGAVTDETFAVTAGGSYAMTDKATFNIQGQWQENNVVGDSDGFSVAANVAYQVVDGLIVTPEVVWRDNGEVGSDDEFGGFLRVQRSF